MISDTMMISIIAGEKINKTQLRGERMNNTRTCVLLIVEYMITEHLDYHSELQVVVLAFSLLSTTCQVVIVSASWKRRSLQLIVMA